MYTESIDTKVKYKRSTDRLKSIAFLKGLAICMVVLVHSRQRIPVDYSGYNAAGKVLAYIGKYIGEYGQFGCQLFFVISALTLCMSWNNKYGISDSGLKPANILSFYKKRFLAIAPGYYTIIFVGYIVNRFIFDNLSISKNLML